MSLCVSWWGQSKSGPFSHLPHLLFSPGHSWVLAYLLKMCMQVQAGRKGARAHSISLETCQASYHCLTCLKSLLKPWLVPTHSVHHTGQQRMVDWAIDPPCHLAPKFPQFSTSTESAWDYRLPHPGWTAQPTHRVGGLGEREENGSPRHKHHRLKVLLTQR